MTTDFSKIDASDPVQLCEAVEVINPLTMAARLNVDPTVPPPSLSCPINPAGVENGGRASYLHEASISQSLIKDLPAAPPNMSEDANNVFKGPDQILPAPEFKV